MHVFVAICAGLIPWRGVSLRAIARLQMSLNQHGLPVKRMNAAFKLC